MIKFNREKRILFKGEKFLLLLSSSQLLKIKAERSEEEPFFFCSLFVNSHLDPALIVKPFCEKQKENGRKKRKKLYSDLSFPIVIYRHCSSWTSFLFYLFVLYASYYYYYVRSDSVKEVFFIENSNGNLFHFLISSYLIS